MGILLGAHACQGRLNHQIIFQPMVGWSSIPSWTGVRYPTAEHFMMAEKARLFA
jgi:hypothetical protein